MCDYNTINIKVLLVCYLYIIDLICLRNLNILEYKMMTKSVEQVT